jgi:type II secretory pathway pseudopilin PulG
MEVMMTINPKCFRNTAGILAFKKGMTLIEIMVSLVILMVILGAIFSILNMQQSRAVDVQATSVLQTDAQVALTLFSWDLYMAGYGLAIDDTSIVSTNNATPTSSDNITLHGAGLAFESGRANWSPVLTAVKQSNEIEVFRFADSLANLNVNDTIIIVDQTKKLIDSNLVITSIDTAIHMVGQDTVPAFKLTLNRTVSVGQGTLVFSPDHNTYFNGVTYTINNKKLMRGNDIFLDNIEDIQFAYGVDFNDNGVFEVSEWFNDLNAIPDFSPQLLYQHKTAIRSTFVVLSEKRIPGYTYPSDTISIEDHAYALDMVGRGFKREIVTAIVQPRNLRR